MAKLRMSGTPPSTPTSTMSNTIIDTDTNTEADRESNTEAGYIIRRIRIDKTSRRIKNKRRG